MSERFPPLPGDPSLRVIAVVGPTAVGKTAIAEQVAAARSGQIVSADSMQVYTGMDIGTAKPAPSERPVAYHCIDLVSPGTEYSAAMFQSDARAAIDRIACEGDLPVVVGGTGLYLRAALDDMRFPAGHAEDPIRLELENDARTLGPRALYDRLVELDPESAAHIHPNNLRRTIRALEMAAHGISYAQQAAGFSDRTSVYDTRFLGLTMDRERLYARIDQRVVDMVERGLLDEVRGLLQAGFRDALTSSQAIGYKEFVPVIEQGSDLDAAIRAVAQATRRYAKRQLTWFRSDPRIAWLDVTELSPAEATSTGLDLLESGKSSPYPAAAGPT